MINNYNNSIIRPQYYELNDGRIFDINQICSVYKYFIVEKYYYCIEFYGGNCEPVSQITQDEFNDIKKHLNIINKK